MTTHPLSFIRAYLGIILLVFFAGMLFVPQTSEAAITYCVAYKQDGIPQNPCSDTMVACEQVRSALIAAAAAGANVTEIGNCIEKNDAPACSTISGASCKAACEEGESAVEGQCEGGGACCLPDDDGGGDDGGGGDSGGLVPCSGLDCSFCSLVDLANNVIKWLIGILFVIFAVLIAVAGFKLVTSGGNVSAKEAAKSALTNAIIGIFIILAAWLIVDTVMRGLLKGGTGEISGYGPWSQVQCQDQKNPTIDYNEDDPGVPVPEEPGPEVPVSPAGQLCFAGSGSGAVCFPAYDIDTSVYPYAYPSGVAAPSKFVKFSELSSEKISRYYSFCQLTRCGAKIGDYVYLDPRAVAAMDIVTDQLGGRTLTINSGYRSPAYNASVGGATRSQHMQGLAFDISASGGLTTSQIQAACKKAGAGFTKLYSTFTHCDWR